MTKLEAVQFFAEWLGGEHHIKGEIRDYGLGWCLNVNGSIATFDDSYLTRLVFLAHERCMRVEVVPASSSYLKIAIWKRQRDGGISERHPDLNTAVDRFKLANSVQE